MSAPGRDTLSEGQLVPLMLTSIRLPVALVRLLDEVAAEDGINRSEVIRMAVAAYVRERRGGVGPSEAERALEVLRRVVGQHAEPYQGKRHDAGWRRPTRGARREVPGAGRDA